MILRFSIWITVFSPIESLDGKAIIWGGCDRNNTKMTVSRPKMVRFHSVKRVSKGKLTSITSEYSWGGYFGENTVS